MEGRKMGGCLRNCSVQVPVCGMYVQYNNYTVDYFNDVLLEVFKFNATTYLVLVLGTM